MNGRAGGKRRRPHDPWRVHGYFFALCLPLFGIPLMRFSVSWMDIPPDVPLKDALTPAMTVVFFLLLGASFGIAYLLARFASLGKIALVDAARRRVERARG